jgi:homoserine/homoserine lactone efflux protein
MPFHVWLLYCGTEAAFSLSPGPAVLMVVSQTLRGGMRPGQITTLGILAGNQIYFLISALLIATASAIDTTSFYWIRIAGALWLAGLMFAPLWRWARSSNKAEMERHPPRLSGAGTFLTGILLQLANPKTIVFFVAFLPQFIDPRVSLSVQFSILAVSSFAIEYTILTGYGLLAREAGSRLGGPVTGGRMKLVGNLGLALAVGWWIFRG